MFSKGGGHKREDTVIAFVTGPNPPVLGQWLSSVGVLMAWGTGGRALGHWKYSVSEAGCWKAVSSFQPGVEEPGRWRWCVTEAVVVLFPVPPYTSQHPERMSFSQRMSTGTKESC